MLVNNLDTWRSVCSLKQEETPLYCRYEFVWCRRSLYYGHEATSKISKAKPHIFGIYMYHVMTADSNICILCCDYH